jgi:hypothetical protein
MTSRQRELIRLATAVVTAFLLLVIAINTTSTAGDATSAERAIESYAKALMWMFAILGVAVSVYIASRFGQ